MSWVRLYAIDELAVRTPRLLNRLVSGGASSVTADTGVKSSQTLLLDINVDVSKLFKSFEIVTVSLVLTGMCVADDKALMSPELLSVVESVLCSFVLGRAEDKMTE